jgi:hypothetical protein
MASPKERGDETKVWYEIFTAPSAVRVTGCICLVRVAIVRRSKCLAIILFTDFRVVVSEGKDRINTKKITM